MILLDSNDVEEIHHKDGSVTIFVDLPYDVLSDLYLIAHKGGITLNELIVEAIKTALDTDKQVDTSQHSDETSESSS